MSEAKKLRDKFNLDLATLQEECPHSESSWKDEMWDIGYLVTGVLVCNRCGKILERESVFDAVYHSSTPTASEARE